MEVFFIVKQSTTAPHLLFFLPRAQSAVCCTLTHTLGHSPSKAAPSSSVLTLLSSATTASTALRLATTTTSSVRADVGSDLEEEGLY